MNPRATVRGSSASDSFVETNIYAAFSNNCKKSVSLSWHMWILRSRSRVKLLRLRPGMRRLRRVCWRPRSWRKCANRGRDRIPGAGIFRWIWFLSPRNRCARVSGRPSTNGGGF